MRQNELRDVPCSIVRPLTVLGERWTLVVVRQAFAGVRRFDDFQSSLGISRSRLTERLNLLVEEGILERVPYKEGRTRYEYRLTEKGHDLYPVLMALRAWGDRYMSDDGAPIDYRHRDCGGAARLHLDCDRCGTALTARDVVLEAGPGAWLDPEAAKTLG